MTTHDQHVNLLDEMELYGYGQFIDRMVIVDGIGWADGSGRLEGFAAIFAGGKKSPADVEAATALSDRIRSVG